MGFRAEEFNTDSDVEWLGQVVHLVGVGDGASTRDEGDGEFDAELLRLVDHVETLVSAYPGWCHHRVRV